MLAFISVILLQLYQYPNFRFDQDEVINAPSHAETNIMCAHKIIQPRNMLQAFDKQ